MQLGFTCDYSFFNTQPKLKLYKLHILAACMLCSTASWCQVAKNTITTTSKIPAKYEKIYTDVQRSTFQYFWEGAEPVSGLARERFNVDGKYPQNDQNVVTTGGGGFGVMAILVGIERGIISRRQAFERLQRIVNFLDKADRFHGAWPHWIYGETGKVKPFSKKDDGGDLVESSFMLQGLLAVRQYFKNGNQAEKALSAKIDRLWKDVDFDWYRRGQNVLYWHWSPNFGWDMNFAVKGYNECLIMYVLAASSPTHGVPAKVYDEGWAQSCKINAVTTKYNYTLTLSHQGAKEYGGPLFWSQYSYLGLDPTGLKDKYANYWENNRNHTLINRAWCIENPKKYKGYGADSWGLTASYSVNGYAAHAPGLEKDLGVISPTAALSSMPYTPTYSMQAMEHWYQQLGNKVYGQYGFYDAFSETENWFPKKYLAIDQGPIVVMMENYRTGLLWNLFMSCPEIQNGLKKLGFKSPHFQYRPAGIKK
jgi:hypothetical protein